MTEIELATPDYVHFVCTLFDKQGKAWNAYAPREDDYILVSSRDEPPVFFGTNDLIRFEYSGEFVIYKLDGAQIDFDFAEIDRLSDIQQSFREGASSANDQEKSAARLRKELQELRELHHKLEFHCELLRNRASGAPPPLYKLAGRTPYDGRLSTLRS